MAQLHKCDFPGCQKTETAVRGLAALAPLSWHMVSYHAPRSTPTRWATPVPTDRSPPLGAPGVQDFIFCPDHGGAVRFTLGLDPEPAPPDRRLIT